MHMLWKMDKAEMLKRHVLFQEEDRYTYVQSLLSQVMNAQQP
jgi:hypothetical protein